MFRLVHRFLGLSVLQGGDLVLVKDDSCSPQLDVLLCVGIESFGLGYHGGSDDGDCVLQDMADDSGDCQGASPSSWFLWHFAVKFVGSLLSA